VKGKALFWLGSVLTLVGTMILCTVYLGVAIHMPQMKGWGYPPGKLMVALSATGGEYFGLAGLTIVVAGSVLLYKGYWALSNGKDSRVNED
jgi:predicted benzoate:H+ symporter BenE